MKLHKSNMVLNKKLHRYLLPLNYKTKRIMYILMLNFRITSMDIRIIHKLSLLGKIRQSILYIH